MPLIICLYTHCHQFLISYQAFTSTTPKHRKTLALLKVNDNIDIAKSNSELASLLLCNLQAVFDTIDQPSFDPLSFGFSDTRLLVFPSISLIFLSIFAGLLSLNS